MPGEEQDEDDAPGGEQPIGDEADEFVQADTELEDDSDEAPEDGVAETADAEAGDSEDDADSAESEAEAAAAESTEAEKPQKGPDEVFCTSCGEPIKKQAEVCPHCGVRQEGSSSSGSVEKNPGIAAIASLILPGAGDLYNGELDRAAIVFIAWFVGGIVWGTIITIIGVITLGIGLILAPLYLVTNFVSAYLSYQRTEQINAGELEV